jgi:general secretion pathway protein G
MLRRNAGCLVTIVIVLSILGAIAIPNFLTALNRSRQKRTMADMRTIATALEARATDEDTYAIESLPVSLTATDFTSLTPVPLNALERALTPKYMRMPPPRLDGWENEFEVRVGAKSYGIRSRGSDGDADPIIRFNYRIQSFEEDLVFAGGNFIQYPEET